MFLSLSFFTEGVSQFYCVILHFQAFAGTVCSSLLKRDEHPTLFHYLLAIVVPRSFSYCRCVILPPRAKERPRFAYRYRMRRKEAETFSQCDNSGAFPRS